MFLLRQTMQVSLIGVFFACLVSCGNTAPTPSSLQGTAPTATKQGVCTAVRLPACHIRVLVFSKTGAFRHASIPDAIAALRRLAMSQHVAIDFTEDASVFTARNLSRYNAVVFLLTTGKILDIGQKAAFEHYIRHGGGYAGVHSASDTEYDWSWYGQLVGAYFDRVHGHSRVVQASIHVLDSTHASTRMLPTVWVRTDEWYNFASNPRGVVHVLMTVDETTYSGGVMGVDHPIAWYHAFDGGRSWYTAMGHTSESYKEPLFLAHLWGGVLYAAGVGVTHDIQHIALLVANSPEIVLFPIDLEKNLIQMPLVSPSYQVDNTVLFGEHLYKSDSTILHAICTLYSRT